MWVHKCDGPSQVRNRTSQAWGGPSLAWDYRHRHRHVLWPSMISPWLLQLLIKILNQETLETSAHIQTHTHTQTHTPILSCSIICSGDMIIAHLMLQASRKQMWRELREVRQERIVIARDVASKAPLSHCCSGSRNTQTAILPSRPIPRIWHTNQLAGQDLGSTGRHTLCNRHNERSALQEFSKICWFCSRTQFKVCSMCTLTTTFLLFFGIAIWRHGSIFSDLARWLQARFLSFQAWKGPSQA